MSRGQGDEWQQKHAGQGREVCKARKVLLFPLYLEGNAGKGIDTVTETCYASEVGIVQTMLRSALIHGVGICSAGGWGANAEWSAVH